MPKTTANRFSLFNETELLFLWNGLKKQREFWQNNPDLCPPGAIELTDCIQAELHEALKTP